MPDALFRVSTQCQIDCKKQTVDLATANSHTLSTHVLLFFLLLMLLFRSVCHQVSNQADKLDLLAIFIFSRHFAHLFKWASSGQCFLTTYNMQLTNNKKQ